MLLTTLITPLCVLASWSYIKTRVREFMICLLIMETAMIGVFCALDSILFFVFWEAMLIPMALLIGVWGGPRRIYASLKFFIYTMAGSVFLLVALIALRLHDRHLPHPRPDGPAVRSRLPVLDLRGVLHLLRDQGADVPVPHVAARGPRRGAHGRQRAARQHPPQDGHVRLPAVLPADHALRHRTSSRRAILWLSVAAILYGGFAALAQTDLKKLVAYSSVGHMGFATLGIFALNARGIEGAMLVMINHGVTTGALFIAVGIIYERLHTRDLDAAAGLGKFMPVFAFFLGVFCLSSLAFPGTNSFIGEFLVLAGGFARLQAAGGLRRARRGRRRRLQPAHAPARGLGRHHNPDHAGLTDLNLREIVTLAPLLVFVFWIGLHPQPFVNVMHASVQHLLAQAGALP